MRSGGGAGRHAMGRTLASLLAGGLLLAGCQAEVDVDVDRTGPSPTATQTTPTPTGPPTPTPTVTPTVTPTGEGQALLRDLIVAPQEPVTVAPGSRAEFALLGRLGEPDADLPPLVGFGWVPCNVVDATQPGALVFPDPDTDGHADRMGESDTGSASLATVNGEPFENVDDEWPTALHTRDEQPALELAMRAEEPDCATVVLFVDDDGDEELDLAADDTPTEVYGVAEARWRS